LALFSVLLLTACSEEEGIPGGPGGAAQSAGQVPPPPPPPPGSGASAVAESAAPTDANDPVTPVLRCYRQITDALASVNDEPSARAAAPILTQATDQLKPAMERLVSAAMSGSLSPDNTNIEENANAFYKMQSEIERVGRSPAGQYIKPELKRLLDTLVEGAIGRERDRLQKWIQEQKLDQ
jgi:hypothetical protein